MNTTNNVKRIIKARKCPHCGNTDPAFLQNNGSPGQPADAMLCIARVDPSEWSFGVAPWPDDIGPDGKVGCGMQWDLDGER